MARPRTIKTLKARFLEAVAAMQQQRDWCSGSVDEYLEQIGIRLPVHTVTLHFDIDQARLQDYNTPRKFADALKNGNIELYGFDNEITDTLVVDSITKQQEVLGDFDALSVADAIAKIHEVAMEAHKNEGFYESPNPIEKILEDAGIPFTKAQLEELEEYHGSKRRHRYPSW